jgi:hypothetical protein
VEFHEYLESRMGFEIYNEHGNSRLVWFWSGSGWSGWSGVGLVLVWSGWSGFGMVLVWFRLVWLVRFWSGFGLVWLVVWFWS